MPNSLNSINIVYLPKYITSLVDCRLSICVLLHLLLYYQPFLSFQNTAQIQPISRSMLRHTLEEPIGIQQHSRRVRNSIYDLGQHSNRRESLGIHVGMIEHLTGRRRLPGIMYVPLVKTNRKGLLSKASFGVK